MYSLTQIFPSPHSNDSKSFVGGWELYLTNTQRAQLLRPSTAPCGRLLKALLLRYVQYTACTNVKTCNILYKSLVVSVFTYCLPNLININALQLNKLNVLWNKCTHKILGINSYKMTTSSILNKIEWLSFPQTIQHESLKLLHKISFDMTPPALTQYLYHSLHRSDIARLTRKPSVKYQHKTI